MRRNAGCRQWGKKHANMFTVNTLRQSVNEPQAPVAQKLGSQPPNFPVRQRGSGWEWHPGQERVPHGEYKVSHRQLIDPIEQRGRICVTKWRLHSWFAAPCLP